MNRREFVKGAAAAVVASAVRARGQQASPAQSAIPRRPLGKTGVDVPVLILGGVAGMKQAPTLSFHPAQLAEAALDAGINYFDTAPSYANGQSESNYGEVLATRRKEVFLACKTEKRSYDECPPRRRGQPQASPHGPPRPAPTARRHGEGGLHQVGGAQRGSQGHVQAAR